MVVELVVGGANLTVRTRRWVGPYKSRGCGARRRVFFFFLPSDPDWEGREGKDFQGGSSSVWMLFPVYFIFHLQTRWPPACQRGN